MQGIKNLRSITKRTALLLSVPIMLLGQLTILGFSKTHADPISQLIATVNPGYFNQLTFSNGNLFAFANDGTHGYEFWKSDGTEAGTTMVKDINPGSSGSSPTLLKVVNGISYFAPDDGTHGYEFWKSDGTEAGTTMVKDINPGSGSSFPGLVTELNGTLYFNANDGTHGYEFWKSDGTEAGTTMVKDINPGSGSSFGAFEANVGGVLYGVQDDGTHGNELWKSDGTEAGTTMVKDINPGSTSSSISNLTDVNGKLFFVTSVDGGTTNQLWKTDGTEAGTVMVSSINVDIYGPQVFRVTAMGNNIYFPGRDDIHGTELWKTDGTEAGTVMVKDIVPDSGGSYPSYLITVNNTLVFAASSDGGPTFKLWRSDGTAAGTQLLYNFTPVGMDDTADFGTAFFAANHYVYFNADDSHNGNARLWKTDGTTAGTTLVSGPNNGGNKLAYGDDTLFFVQGTGSLWKLKNVETLSSPQNLTATSPTNGSPMLSWSSEAGADHYNIYRDGKKVASSSTNSYIDDSPAAAGRHTYTVSQVDSSGNESGQSNLINMVVDGTPPTLGAPQWSANPTNFGQNSNLVVSASDDLTGVSQGEYFISDDPGLGNGTAMTWDGTNLTTSLGADLTPGTYSIGIRAKDNVGNWSGTTYTTLSVNPYTAPASITSANSTSVNVRSLLNFQVTTTGTPTAGIAESGSLPTGVTFTDNGDGTASLSGQPVAGTNGTYPITFTASNGVGSPATQNFTLTVTANNVTPTFLNDNSDVETYGVPFSFTVNTSGFPLPTITKSGALPAGVTLVDNHDGTATISGTPASSAVGVYNLTLKAKNSVATKTQAFTLTISRTPIIRSAAGPKSTTVGGAPFAITVKSVGYSVPSLSASGLPSGVTLTDNGNGTAMISGAPDAGSGGKYTVTITATNSEGSSTKNITLTVNEPPTIVSGDSTTVGEGANLNFQVSSTGFPLPHYSLSGTLPKGVTFKSGTGTLTGVPKTGTHGTYSLTITATNSLGTSTQNFTLTVSGAVIS